MSLNGASTGVVVAVDAMGGDHAPEEVIQGALEAQRRGVNVVLVGKAAVLRDHLDGTRTDLPIADASEHIGMDEPVSQALRKRNSSLRVAADLVTAGKAQAVVSCGNSAAIMAVALHSWGMQEGIDRPAFGGTLPTRLGGVFLLDIGANPTVKASNLVQFAIMGEVYVRLSKNIERPRVALLSNGTEDNKGTKEVKEANAVLRKLDMNFVGNVEGNHIFMDRADVVVCDGFSGNVLLKGAEGTASEIVDLIREELTRDVFSRVAAAGLRPAFERVRRRIDFEEYGGAPVLGVNEIMVNCHGRSRAKAVSNAISIADRLATERLIQRIGLALQHDEADAVGRRSRLARALHLRHSES